MKKIPFAYSIHPGEILKTEFTEPLGLSSYRLAKDLHVSAPQVNDIVLGKRGVTADTEMRLSAYFGCSASSGSTCKTSTTSGSPPRTNPWSRSDRGRRRRNAEDSL
jgi:addiction module HigA family antidote